MLGGFLFQMVSPLRHLVVAVLVVTGGYYAYTALTGPRGITTIGASHTEVRKMEEENERLRLEIEKHRQFIHKLETDPEMRDRMIRSRLEKQKPGETTIYDTGELPASPAAPIR